MATDTDTALDTNDLIPVTRVNSDGDGEAGAVTAAAIFNDVGVGYSSGGAVTQGTSITTGVTLNALSGAITTVSQTVAAGAEADFIVTNSEVAATDVVVVNIKDHTSAGTFLASVSDVSAGAFTIRLTNLHASAAGDNVLVLNFAVIKGAAA